MKVKTNSLTDLALDWAVAKIEHAGQILVIVHKQARIVYPNGLIHVCAFSTDWDQGGPIIERERLILRPSFDGGWECAANPSVWRTGSTALIASMRCYVASKLGDEVDIPEALA